MVAELEKKIRMSREKLSHTDNEYQILRHTVDELRRQQNDLERTRRTAEDSISQSQQQTQLAVRTMHQMNAQTEQKRIEWDALICELRTCERRHEELKRASRDLELQQDSR